MINIKAFRRDPPSMVIKLFIGLILNLYLPHLCNASVLLLGEQQSQYSLNSHLQYLEDKTSSLSISTIVSDKERRLPFKSLSPINPSFGWSKSTYWLHFSPFNNGDKDRRWLIEFDYPLLDQIDIWKKDKKTTVKIASGGDLIPFNKRSIKNHKQTFELFLKAGEKYDIYIRINSESILNLGVMLWNHEAFHQQQQSSITQQSIYTGLLLGLAMYNLLLFFSLKDKSYILYSLCITFILLSHLTHSGISSRWLWPESSAFNNISVLLSVSLSNAIVPVFFRSFLQVSHTHPYIDKTLIGISLLFSLTFFIVFIDYTTAAIILSYGAMIGLVFYFWSCFYIWVNGLKSARFLLASWAIYLASSLLYILALVGWLPESIRSYNFLLIGSAISLTTLAIALADRLSINQAERSNLKSKLLQQSQSSNALKTAFLATVSHELRTPIHGIKGSLDIFNNRHLCQEDLQALAMAQQSTNNLQRLIDRLLIFSDAIAGQLKIENEEFNLNTELDLLTTEYQTLYPNIEIEYRQTCAELIFSDRKKIITALQQVFDNSCRFCGHGQVSIYTKTVKTDEQKKQLVIIISDNGPGIKKNLLDRVVSNFSQADQSFSRQYGGIGVGLALCQALIKLLQGSFEISSEWGRGTDITLRIPTVTTAKTAEIHTPKTLAKSLNILVVEDNPINQKILSAQLKRMGHRIICAENGKVATELYLSQDFELIFMDCQMPIMDGLEATRIIRQYEKDDKSESAAAISIIAITANAMSGDRDKCLEAGMDDYLSKPVTPQQLQAAIDRNLT